MKIFILYYDSVYDNILYQIINIFNHILSYNGTLTQEILMANGNLECNILVEW